MDYKKEYEDTLSKAKTLHKLAVETNNDNTRMALEELYPELKESEDERIRKDIIAYMRYERKSTEEEIENRFIPWLEKQGEQKANEIHPIFRVGDYIKNKKTSDKVLIEQLDVKLKVYYYTSYDGAAKNHSDFPFSKQDEWELIGQKSVEQKPAEYTLKDAADIFLDALSKTPYNNKPITDAQVITRELLKFLSDARTYNPNALNEQKSEELPNGEDYGIDSLYHAARILEKTLGEVEGYESDDGILEHKCAIEAVKRLYKQKPAWSKEDEIMFKNTIALIETIEDDNEAHDGFGDVKFWLKSLKERYTWKPSEEQIRVLEYYMNVLNCNEHKEVLFGLYEQLKSL